MKRHLLIFTSACLAVSLVFGLAGCGTGKTGRSRETTEEVIVDQIYKTDMDDQTVFLFRFGDHYYETESLYGVNVTGFDISCEDGGFVKLDCDVTYLSGGEEGFDHYPELRVVKKVTPVTIEETIPPGGSLPQVATRTFGFSVIGSYADADYCLWSGRIMGVLKSGKWLYKYDDSFYTDDGATVCFKEGTDKDEIMKKIGEGVVLCEDFFVMPVRDKAS